MESNSPEAQAELARRHKAAARTVVGLIIATVLLSVVAFVTRPYLPEQPPNPPLDKAVRIVVLILGLGAIAWRRTKFSTIRLQAITGLAGPSGLIRTLEKTTLQIALIAVAIAVIGFITTLVLGNELYTYWSGAIALVVLVYGYPTKSSWGRTLQRFTEPPAEPAE